MKRTIHHIPVVLLVLMMSVLFIPASLATAQDASPEAGPSLLDGLGLPAFEVTLTSDGMESPAEFGAGPALLSAHNETEDFAYVDIVQLPDGVTVDEYLVVSSSEGGIPAWAAEVVIAGGVELPPMASSSIAVNLAPGEWTVIAGSETPFAEPAAPLTVTGEAAPDAADAIPADLDVSLGAYVFDIPETIAAGPQIWQLTNTHTILHHILVFQVDALYTADEVAAGFMSEFSGTPVAEGFSFASIISEFGSPVISGGQSIWIEADVAPGYYVAVCFISDPGSDVPHAMAGMIDTFEALAD